MHPRMTKKLLYVTVVAALAIVAVVAFALPAAAEQRTFKVQLSDGSVITVTVQAACVPMDQVHGLPGTPVEDLTPPGVCGDVPTPPPAPTTPATPPPPDNHGGGNAPGPSAAPPPGGGGNDSPSTRPSSDHGHRQGHSRSPQPARPDDSADNPQPQDHSESKKHHHKKSPRR